MDAYEQEYRFCDFARCPYEKTDMAFRSIPLTTESVPQKEGGEAVWVLIIFTVSKAWIYFPLSMKAQPSGQWRRKVSAPRKASSTAESKPPTP